MDQYRRDIVEKDRLIDKKNKEIVKLRMHVEDVQNQLESQVVTMPQKERFAVIQELDYLIEVMQQELERIKSNLFKDETKSSRSFKQPTVTIHQFNSEENMVKLLIERVNTMKGMVNLAQEIQLLAQGKNSVSP